MGGERTEVNEPWYAAKCVFRIGKADEDSPGCSIYEERIVLVRADSGDEAIAKAERLAEEYAREHPVRGARYLGYVEMFHLFEDELVDGAEVFSLLRTSPLEPREFLDHYHGDGSEHAEGFDEPTADADQTPN